MKVNYCSEFAGCPEPLDCVIILGCHHEHITEIWYCRHHFPGITGTFGLCCPELDCNSEILAAEAAAIAFT